MIPNHRSIHPSSIQKPQFLQYSSLFRSVSSGHVLTGLQARPVLASSGLSVATLRTIWDLSDLSHDGCLDLPEFAIAMHLVDCVKLGFPLPSALSHELISSARAGGLDAPTSPLQQQQQQQQQPQSYVQPQWQPQQFPYMQHQHQHQHQHQNSYMHPQQQQQKFMDHHQQQVFMQQQQQPFVQQHQPVEDDFGDFEGQGVDDDFGDFESAFVSAEPPQPDVQPEPSVDLLGSVAHVPSQDPPLAQEPVSVGSEMIPASSDGSQAPTPILEDLLSLAEPAKIDTPLDSHGAVRRNIVTKAVHILDLFAEESKPKPKLRDLMKTTPTKMIDPQQHLHQKPSAPSKAYDVFTKLVQEDLGIVDSNEETPPAQDDDFGNFEAFNGDDTRAVNDADAGDQFGDFASAFDEEANDVHESGAAGQGTDPSSERRHEDHRVHAPGTMEFKLNPVQYLTELGFDSKAATVALEKCDWNTEAAANLLLAQEAEPGPSKGNEWISSEDEFGDFEEYNDKGGSDADHPYPMPQYIDQQGERLFDWSLAEDDNNLVQGQLSDVLPDSSNEVSLMKGNKSASDVVKTGRAVDLFHDIHQGIEQEDRSKTLAGISEVAGYMETAEDDFGEFGGFDGEEAEPPGAAQGDEETALTSGATKFNLDEDSEEEGELFGYRNDEGQESSGSSLSRPAVDEEFLQNLRAQMLTASMEELKTCALILEQFQAAAGAENAHPQLQEEVLRSSRMEMYISGAAALSSVASRLAWKLQVSVDKDELQARVLSSGIREWRQWWEAQVAGEEEAAYRAGKESCVVCGVGLEVVGKGVFLGGYGTGGLIC
ncbi:hypothetical protein GUITHDRAFT_110376 [Guillardia theta CCMP2712]|uniref:UBA domain-containing protein n=1 Tax=Guillardia theta (strain CCMP2712) TaxID=905079 RepID=L1J648_GUITC|nr:hypothetical protein GUITHDRAFT_110376 [Guillardia theta CCMP2712]EKX43570.1 hypothetical protein GUITHDRAFT_110376 [Guillardia theta CCMP2712]|eukprot:XP_005830550.1 hypothetical protein GUITHDRAFT_110376 [Guillardia theta CCMP2712]